jgi:hypothetical protein
MSEIKWAVAWRRDDWKLGADAKAFWGKLGLVSPEERDRRVTELCSMAYADDQLVGVSTVQLQAYPQLRCRLAFYRCAVDPDFRRHELATLLTLRTLITMEGWSAEHPEEQLQGIAAIIQAPELMPKGKFPEWPDYNVQLNLVGYSQRGEQVRVAWFRHSALENWNAAQ